MTDQQTCGRGLAENSVLPAKIGELIAAMADNLELHMTALDTTDENAKKEHDAYLNLTSAQRKIAAELRATGEEMAGYRNLPMGAHDLDAMSSSKFAETFEHFVKIEQELLDFLKRKTKQDEQMLATSRARRDTREAGVLDN